jgi:hypothetical protein
MTMVFLDHCKHQVDSSGDASRRPNPTIPNKQSVVGDLHLRKSLRKPIHVVPVGRCPASIQ